MIPIAWTHSAIACVAQAALLVSIIGDSITFGQMPPGSDGRSYVELVKEELEASVFDLGVGLSRTRHWHPTRGGDVFPGVIFGRPTFLYVPASNVVVVALGTNDIQGGVDEADVVSDLFEILLTLRQRGVAQLIVLLAPGPQPSLGALWERRWRRIRLAQRLACSAVPSCRIADPMLQPEDYQGADVHPLPSGHERIAKALLPVIRRAIRQQTCQLALPKRSDDEDDPAREQAAAAAGDG